MTDLSVYDIKHLVSAGFHVFGESFVCTLNSCKSSKYYSVYDKYGVDDMKFVCSCYSLSEALSVVRYLRRRGHEVNYILLRECLSLPSPSSGQLSLF